MNLIYKDMGIVLTYRWIEEQMHMAQGTDVAAIMKFPIVIWHAKAMMTALELARDGGKVIVL